MTDTYLQWGLISTSRINRALIPPLRASNRNRLVAIASRDLDRAQAYAKQWKIPRFFGSYEAMLESLDIDVIYNTLPNSLHAEWTIKAVQAGKHVLCEKPLALSVDEVDAIQNAASQNRRVVAEAFMYRHHPQTIKVKELIESGAIGEIRVMHGTFTFSLSNPGDVRLNPVLGGGSVWDVGCYPINYARFVIGEEPEEVFGWQLSSPSGVDMVFTGQLRFPRDVFAQFDCGFQSPFRAQIEIVGTDGSLVLANPFKPGKNEKILWMRGKEVLTIKIPGQELYMGEVEDMADAILNGKSPRVSLMDSRHNVATIIALLTSARKGTPILLKES